MTVRSLVADDDPDIRDFIGFVLERAGHRVTLASDGAEALEHAEQEAYDLMVLDHHMPRTTGLEAAKVLGEAHPRTRVLLMSGDTEVGREHSPFLPKPFNRTELLDAIAGLLGQGGSDPVTG